LNKIDRLKNNRLRKTYKCWYCVKCKLLQ